MQYRGDGPWGTGKGGNLTANDFDTNTWTLVQMIAAKAVQGAGISNITVIGDEMFVTLDDHSTFGPFVLPTVRFVFRGAWAPATVYSVNNIFTENGSTYMVLINHTSASTFDAGANDGSGGDYYGLLLENAPNSLPTGGAVGTFLKKTGTSDFAVGWDYFTIAGADDMLASPAPTPGDLVTYTPGGFSYIAQADVVGEAPAFTDLSDVLPSPAPVAGQVPVFNGTKFTYEYVSAIQSGTTVSGSADVLHSPAPTNGQVLTYNTSIGKFTYETPSAGTIPNLEDLANVSWSTLHFGDVLYWDSDSSQWRNSQPLGTIDWASSTKTLALDEINQIIYAESSGSAQTLTINDTPAWPLGGFVKLLQRGTIPPVSVVAGGSITFSKPAGRTVNPRTQGSVVTYQYEAGANFVVFGDLAYDQTAAALATSGTISVNGAAKDTDVLTITPSGDATINYSNPRLNQRLTLIVTTSGTTPRTLTFGTNFISTGTLSTGSVTAKTFSVAFICDGTNMVELSRTAAM